MLAHVRHRQGRLIGRMEGLGFISQNEAVLATLTLDVLKSSEIEGEILNPDQVRSSIARRLGIDIAGAIPADRDVEGVVEMMLDATQHFADPLTQERLFGWHAALFPTGYGGIHPIRIGSWRDDSKGAMQVISGPISREKVHFEAPAAKRLQHEMDAFLAWVNSANNPGGEEVIDPVLKAAVAHLWFVTIHPFDDGNVVSRGPSRTGRLPDLKAARSGSTACRRRSLGRAQRAVWCVAKCLNAHKNQRSILRTGSSGFWPVSTAQSRPRRQRWERCFAKRRSGTNTQAEQSTSVKRKCSTNSSMGLKES